MPAKRAKSDASAARASGSTRVTRSSNSKSTEKATSTILKAPTTKAEPTPRGTKRKAEAAPQSVKKDKSETASTAPNKKAKQAKTSAAIERDENERCFWLLKAEPETRMENGVDVRFSIDDLAARKEPEPWDGVRNPVAQKNMKKMRKGELAFFYHSNCKVPGIAGAMKIVREASTDQSAFDPKHPYYDPKSNRDSPRWIVVHVAFVKKFDKYITLKTLQEHFKNDGPLANIQMLKMARLSVSQIRPDEWDFILGLAGEDARELETIAGKTSD